MACRNIGVLNPPAPSAPPATANMRASHSPWNVGSSGSTSTGPKPCMPPRSWTPSTSASSHRHARRAGAQARGYHPVRTNCQVWADARRGDGVARSGHRTRLRFVRTGALILVGTLLALVVSGTAAARKAPAPAAPQSYVALGDSYTAGPLIPLQETDPPGMPAVGPQLSTSRCGG